MAPKCSADPKGGTRYGDYCEKIAYNDTITLHDCGMGSHSCWQGKVDAWCKAKTGDPGARGDGIGPNTGAACWGCEQHHPRCILPPVCPNKIKGHWGLYPNGYALTGGSTFTKSYSVEESSSSTHSESLTNAFSIAIKSGIEVPETGSGGVEETYSVSKTQEDSWTKAVSNTTGTSFSVEVPKEYGNANLWIWNVEMNQTPEPKGKPNSRYATPLDEVAIDPSCQRLKMTTSDWALTTGMTDADKPACLPEAVCRPEGQAPCNEKVPGGRIKGSTIVPFFPYHNGDVLKTDCYQLGLEGHLRRT